MSRVVADGQRADAHIADEQRGQHKAPRYGNVHRPHLDEAAVIDVREQDGHHKADARRARLHHGPAVIAHAGDGPGHLVHRKAAALLCGPGGQCHHSHGTAEDAQQQVELIRPLQILSNAFQESTTFRFQMHTGSGCTHRQHKPSLSLLYTDGTAFSICRVEQPCKICVGA